MKFRNLRHSYTDCGKEMTKVLGNKIWCKLCYHVYHQYWKINDALEIEKVFLFEYLTWIIWGFLKRSYHSWSDCDLILKYYIQKMLYAISCIGIRIFNYCKLKFIFTNSISHKIDRNRIYIFAWQVDIFTALKIINNYFIFSKLTNLSSLKENLKTYL